jgi:hypothetical protein
MPALLKIKRTIDNDVWKINFALDTTVLPESDKDLLRKFGEPQVDLGGTYLVDTADEYTLPHKYIRVRSDLPFTQEFDAKNETTFLDDPVVAKAAAQTKALAFQTTFVDAYTLAFTALRASADTFTGEYITNI